MRDIGHEVENCGVWHALFTQGTHERGHYRFNRRMPREGLYLLSRHALI